MSLEYGICPQCGTGKGVFYWMDIFLIRCDHCGYFVDIREMDNEKNYDHTCPGCTLEAIKKAGLWKAECSVPGVGVICTDGLVEFIDEAYDSCEEAVEDFDRAVLAKEISPKKSYITKAVGNKVEFLRGSFKIMLRRRNS